MGLTKEIFENESINNNTRILDVGCGTGQTAAYLADQYGSKVTAIDINPIMVEKAKNRMEKKRVPVEIIQASIENIPLKDREFDLIISESVLAFVNKEKALKEIFRLLKNGGQFIANELVINKPLTSTEEEEVKLFYGIDSVHPENYWIALFKQAGFKNINIRLQDLSMFKNDLMPEFEYSEYIEPELFSVMYQHFNIMVKYEEILSYRIFSCTK